MSKHVASATCFGQPKMVHDLSFYRFVRVRFAKVNGFRRFAYLSNFFLKVSVLVSKNSPARETLDGNNHLLSIRGDSFISFLFISIEYV